MVDAVAHPDLQVLCEPPGASSSRAVNHGGFAVRLTFTAYVNILHAAHLAGTGRRAPIRTPVLAELLDACADARAGTAALVHATFASVAGKAPTDLEALALGELAALTAPGARRVTVSTLHTVLSQGRRPQGASGWVRHIQAVAATVT